MEGMYRGLQEAVIQDHGVEQLAVVGRMDQQRPCTSLAEENLVNVQLRLQTALGLAEWGSGMRDEDRSSESAKTVCSGALEEELGKQGGVGA